MKVRGRTNDVTTADDVSAAANPRKDVWEAFHNNAMAYSFSAAGKSTLVCLLRRPIRCDTDIMMIKKISSKQASTHTSYCTLVLTCNTAAVRNFHLPQGPLPTVIIESRICGTHEKKN